MSLAIAVDGREADFLQGIHHHTLEPAVLFVLVLFQRLRVDHLVQHDVFGNIISTMLHGARGTDEEQRHRESRERREETQREQEKEGRENGEKRRKEKPQSLRTEGKESRGETEREGRREGGRGKKNQTTENTDGEIIQTTACVCWLVSASTDEARGVAKRENGEK